MHYSSDWSAWAYSDLPCLNCGVKSIRWRDKIDHDKYDNEELHIEYECTNCGEEQYIIK